MINWSHRESIQCKAVVKLIDPLSSFECYILAQNPHNPDEIYCLINAFTLETGPFSLEDVLGFYNHDGEGLVQDTEYRPRAYWEIYKKLRETKDDSGKD